MPIDAKAWPLTLKRCQVALKKNGLTLKQCQVAGRKSQLSLKNGQVAGEESMLPVGHRSMFAKDGELSPVLCKIFSKLVQLQIDSKPFGLRKKPYSRNNNITTCKYSTGQGRRYALILTSIEPEPNETLHFYSKLFFHYSHFCSAAPAKSFRRRF